MITELTDEQKKQKAIYRDEYIKTGLSTEPIDRDEINKVMSLFYEKILSRKLKKVIVCDNPLQAYRMCYFYKFLLRKLQSLIAKKKFVITEVKKEVQNEVSNEVWNEVQNELADEVENEVENAVWNEVWCEVRNEVSNEVEKEVSNEVSNEVENEVQNEVSNEVWNEVENEVQNELANEVWNEVRNEVVYEVRNEVEKEVWNAVHNEVWNEVNNEVQNEVSNEVENEVEKIKTYHYPYLFGQFDSAYFSYYSFINKVLGVKYKEQEKYDIYENTKKFNALYCLKTICFASEKPLEINKDDQGRLHADDKPALLYKGFALWRIHGTKVPKKVVLNPEAITINDIQTEQNQEVRRIMIERYGVDKYLVETDSKIIDMDSRTNEGAAPRLLVEDCNGNRWLIVTDGSTERVYHLFVEPRIKTCREAHESVCGFNEDLILIES